MKTETKQKQNSLKDTDHNARYNSVVVKFYLDHHSLIPEGPIISSFYPAPTPITFWIPLFTSGSYKLFFLKVLIAKGLRNFQTFGSPDPFTVPEITEDSKELLFNVHYTYCYLPYYKLKMRNSLFQPCNQSQHQK